MNLILSDAADLLSLCLALLREHSVDADRFIEQALRLKHVSKLLKQQNVFEPERQRLLERIAGLLEPFLTVVETENSVQGPNLRVQVIEDTGLSNRVFGSCQLPKPQETEAEEEPSVG